MRQAWLCLGVLAVLLLAGACAAQAAAPVIERVDIGTVRSMDPEQGYLSTGSEVSVLVRDADGAADIARVEVGCVMARAGVTGSYEWTQEGPDLVRVSWGRTCLVGLGPDEVTVTDTAGLQSQLAVDIPYPPDEEPAVTSPGPGYPVVHDPNTVLAWTGIQPGASNRVTLSRPSELYSWERLVWSYDLGLATSVAYNVDGTAADPQLRPGFRYQWLFSTRVSVDDGATDPRVHTYFIDELAGRFIVFSEEPVIQSVEIWRGSDSAFQGPLVYRQWAGVVVTDAAGVDPSTLITITEPGGAAHSFAQWSGTEGWGQVDPYTMGLRYTAPDAAEPPAAGPYTITVDRPGSLVALVTPSAPVVPVMTLLDPAPDGVVGSTTPTFSWDSGLENPVSAVSLFSLADLQWPFWSLYEQPGEQITYAPAGEGLSPGQTYLWAPYSVATVGGGPDDVTSLYTYTRAERRFTVYHASPALPTLNGKLAFETYIQSPTNVVSLVQQYDPDPWVRQWLGPLYAKSPEWSPDGSMLAYAYDGVTLDPLDDGSPTHVGSGCTIDAAWSPDGSQVVYGQTEPYAGFDIWISRSDGTESHPLVEDDACKRNCGWSPDGQWISYTSWPSTGDTSGEGLWLVRPDGTERHRLTASGVEGYPGYQVDYLGSHGWAPDAGRLTVEFDASPGDGSDGAMIAGIGVIPRDGGLLKPVFLAPEGIVCCPVPKLPTWSGDGTKIAFTSGHHLSANPAWTDGYCDPGVELWMINADGSGEPTRLTYNQGYDGPSSWWAPQLFPDVPKGTWAYCAISTCAQAGLVEGFPGGSYRPELEVTRDQMAVYIARALAGGDDHVPSGPAAATFGDVDQEHWAYNYVEYCAANGIVQGYWGETYHPDEVVTRDQMAVYVSRAIATPTGEAGLTGYTGPDTPSFTDVGADHWAYRYIEYAKEHGVVQGYWDGRYQPALPVTRDQMAIYIARAFRLPM